jgi:uncharacterized membrane protein YhaH (DUF805 family)
MNKDLMLQPLRKYAVFEGRARRAEYWGFTLFLILVGVVIGILMGVTSAVLGQGNILTMLILLLYVLFCLGVLVPSLAVSFRRLHDTNRSALWLLLAFVPFIGGLVLLVFTVLPGTPGPNRFGPDPKGVSENVAEAFA